MLNYKDIKTNIRIMIFVMVGMILNLTACVKNEAVEEKMGATYRVTRVTGQAGAQVYAQDNNGLPGARKFHFKACFADIKTQEPIIDHQFLVYDDDRRISQEVTDPNGCITWSDQVPYNSLAKKPEYKTVELYFKAEGIHRGSVARELAVFPFEKSANSDWPDVVDMELDKNQVPEGMLAQGEANTNKNEFDLAKAPQTTDLNGQLFLEQLRARISLSDSVIRKAQKSERRGFEFDLEISGEPFVYVKSPEGNWTKKKLYDAAFKVTPYLVNVYTTGSGEVKREQMDLGLEPERVEMIGTTLTHEFKQPLQVPFEPNKGQLEIALKIDPIVSGVKPLEASYVWGDFSQIDGQRIINLKANFAQGLRSGQKKSLATYISKKTPEPVEADSSRQGYSYRLTRPRVDFTAVGGGQCDSSLQREVMFQVFVCVENPVNDEPASFSKFQIYRQEESANSKQLLESEQTLWDGCLVWEDSIRFNYYDTQRFFLREYTIKADDRNIAKSVKVAINPWTRFGKLFGRDAQQIEDLPIGETDDGRRPKIIIHNFASEFVEQYYSLDDKLTMRSTRNYEYIFKPRVLRMDSLVDGSSAVEPLKQGMYIVRMVLAENPHNTAEGKDLLVDHFANQSSIEDCWAQHYDKAGFKEETQLSVACQKKLFENINKREFEKLPKYITHYEVPVWVTDGTAKVNVDMSLWDMRHMASHNMLFVEMVPANPDKLVFAPGVCEVDENRSVFEPDPDTKLQSVTYMGYNPLLQEGLSKPMVPVSLSAGDLIEQGLKSQKETQNLLEQVYNKATLSNFARREGLSLVDWKQSGQGEELLTDLNRQSDLIYKARQEAKKMSQSAHTLRFDTEPFESTPYAEVNKKFQAMKFYNFSNETLRDLVIEGRISERKKEARVSGFAHAMCGVWFDDYYSKYLDEATVAGVLGEGQAGALANLPKEPYKSPLPAHIRQGDSVVHDIQRALLLQIEIGVGHPYVDCMKDPFKFFMFEKLIQVEDVAQRSEVEPSYAGGSGQNYIVNSVAMADEVFSWDKYIGWNWDARGSLGLLNIGFGKGLLEFMGIRGSVGVEGGQRVDRIQDRARQIGFTRGAYLVVTRTDFNIQLERYRHCLSVKPNPAVASSFYRGLKPDVDTSGASMKAYTEAGLLICLEEMSKDPGSKYAKTIQESYFYVFQHFASGSPHMNDRNRHNRPLIFMMRGEQEFARFLDLTQALVMPEVTGSKVYEMHGLQQPKELIGLEVDPMVGLSRTAREYGKADYSEKHLLSSYPGIVTEYDNYLTVHDQLVQQGEDEDPVSGLFDKVRSYILSRPDL